ncbi:hypothetical protein [Spongiactinospora sp. TRM90649]|uniref:hypothetical protein n=1 Tax=Spongiactinospora sp. TRM90649 TaxID=3031114 RepID=UPI0023F68BE0|nr:hypothetical protein [Spongiactinospora sp. TRM90649]MDF5755715.1 hypothetical protein [Spongiactinospora sp. TRM90649]
MLALLPTAIAWFGSEIIASTGLFYYDFDVIDGIGILPLSQGLGIGYLGDVGMDIIRPLWNAEIAVLAFALPVPMVAAAALLRRKWRDRTTLLLAVFLGVLAVINFAANIVGPWSDLTHCPPPEDLLLPDGYNCYRNGTGVGVPPFFYGPPYALAAHILLKIHRRNLADLSQGPETRSSADAAA